MQGKLKKCLGVLVCTIVLVLCMPASVFAVQVKPDFTVGTFGYKIQKDNTVYITNFTSTSAMKGEYTLPSTVTYGNTKYTVSGIAQEALMDADATKTFIIPESITFIGEKAFFNCSGLEHVVFKAKSGVTLSKQCFAECRLVDLDVSCCINIGESAFESNVQLTDVMFSNDTQYIGKNAFKGCVQLKYIHNDKQGPTTCALPGGLAPDTVDALGKKIRAIGEGAFMGCASLQNFKMELNVGTLFSFDKNSFNGCTSLTNLVLGDYLYTCIDGSFANCTSLSKVTLGKYFEAVGDNMFANCSVLSTVTYAGAPGKSAVELSDNVFIVGSGAFKNTSIVTVSLPDSLITMGSGVFTGCTNLASLNIPEGVTTIADSFCKGCTSLKTVKLSSKTESIQKSAFDGCTSLQTIDVGTSLVTIGDSAFNGCSSLTSFTMPNSVITLGGKAFQNCNKLVTVVMSPSVQSVPGYTFYNCSSLTSISIGNSAESIGDSAFAGCINLKTVKMPDDNKKLITIGVGAFMDCQALTSLRIPEGIKLIPKNMVKGCTSLSTISLPISLTTISDSAFAKCTSLTSLSIPSQILTIPVNMCMDCTSLKVVNLPVGIQTIADYAFAGCSSLTSVTNIQKATTVGAYVFRNCSSLKTLSLNPSIYIVPDHLCDGCTSLTSFDFTNITNIGNSSFASCGFVTLDLPNTITNIEVAAFNKCAALTTLKLPTNSSLTTIKQNSFAGCTSLENCVIPNTISVFGNNAFSNCKAVEFTSATAPDLATGFTAGNHPFGGVTYVYVPFKSTGYDEGGWVNSKKNNKSNIYYKGQVTFDLSDFRDVKEESYSLNYKSYTVTLSPTYGYSLPDSVNVTYTSTGASVNSYVSYDKNSGTITIDTSSFTSPITIKAVAVKRTTNNTPTAAPTTAPVEVDRDQLEGFVTRCYSLVLEREPDATGLAGWADQLEEGSICGAHVAYGFFFSPEFINKNVSNETFVTLLYNVFLNRAPDATGLAGWTQQLNEGASREAVYAGFANSQEFFNLCSDYGIATGFYVQGVDYNSQKNVNAFVARLYSKCFGRLPDQGGQSGWVSQLLNGQTSGASAGYGFFFSPEFINRNTSDADYVKTLYNVFMGRAADEGGLNYWLEQLSSGMSREDVFRGFAHSAEYTTICESFGIIRGTI